MLAKSVDGKDYVALDFVNCYKTEGSYKFVFDVSMKINCFACGEHPFEVENSGSCSHNRIWVEEESFGHFIQDLRELNRTLEGKALLNATDDCFHLSIERYNRYGYLLVNTTIRYQTREHFENKPIEHCFQGGFMVEPANLTEWFAMTNTMTLSSS